VRPSEGNWGVFASLCNGQRHFEHLWTIAELRFNPQNVGTITRKPAASPHMGRSSGDQFLVQVFKVHLTNTVFASLPRVS
jgi:hypothetical protein